MNGSPPGATVSAVPVTLRGAARRQLFPTMRHPRRTGPLLLRPVPAHAPGSEGDCDFKLAGPASPRGGKRGVAANPRQGGPHRDSEVDSEGETVSRLIGPEK